MMVSKTVMRIGAGVNFNNHMLTIIVAMLDTLSSVFLLVSSYFL